MAKYTLDDILKTYVCQSIEVALNDLEDVEFWSMHQKNHIMKVKYLSLVNDRYPNYRISVNECIKTHFNL